MFYIKTLLIALPIALLLNLPSGLLKVIAGLLILLGGFISFIFYKLSSLLAKKPTPKGLIEFAKMWGEDLTRKRIMGELAGSTCMLLIFSFLYNQNMLIPIFVTGVVISVYALLIHTSDIYMDDIDILKEKMNDEDFWR